MSHIRIPQVMTRFGLGFTFSILLGTASGSMPAFSCTRSDMTILGSSSEVRTNIINCLASESSDLADCLAGIYPNFNNISTGCKLCTGIVYDSMTAECKADCQDAPESSSCLSCTESVDRSWNSACNPNKSGEVWQPYVFALVLLIASVGTHRD